MMHKTFHMSFSNIQRQAHRFAHGEGNGLRKADEGRLAQLVIRTMDVAEDRGIDLARAVLDELDARKPRRRRTTRSKQNADV